MEDSENKTDSKSNTLDPEVFKDPLVMLQESLNSGIKSWTENHFGRPLEYTDEIGMFIVNGMISGMSVQKVCNHYNEIMTGESDVIIISPVKVYHWIKNPKLSHFQTAFYYARNLQTETILDHIIETEEDIEDGTLDSRPGRVILESKRWRAKVQNPDYFNPVDKKAVLVKGEIVIQSNIPLPKLLEDVDIIEAEAS